MHEPDEGTEEAIRERAYFIWEREERPEGRAQDHWHRAVIEVLGDKRGPDDALMADEEKVLAGGAEVNMPALLTKDVPGG